MDLAVVVRGRSRWPVVRHGPCIWTLYIWAAPIGVSCPCSGIPPPQTVGLVAVLDYPIEARQGGIIQHNAELCKMIPFPVLD